MWLCTAHHHTVYNSINTERMLLFTVLAKSVFYCFTKCEKIALLSSISSQLDIISNKQVTRYCLTKPDKNQCLLLND